MRRSIAILALLAAACGSKQQPASPVMTEEVAATTDEPVAETGPGFEEPADCLAPTLAHAPTAAEQEYAQKAETPLKAVRQLFGNACSRTAAGQISWPTVWLSSGFDAEEHPMGVSAAMTDFLTVSATVCASNGDAWREKIEQVQFTATETADRVGLCHDADSKTLVVRFMLGDDMDVTYWKGKQIADWYKTNL